MRRINFGICELVAGGLGTGRPNPSSVLDSALEQGRQAPEGAAPSCPRLQALTYTLCASNQLSWMNALLVAVVTETVKTLLHAPFLVTVGTELCTCLFGQLHTGSASVTKKTWASAHKHQQIKHARSKDSKSCILLLSEGCMLFHTDQCLGGNYWFNPYLLGLFAMCGDSRKPFPSHLPSWPFLTWCYMQAPDQDSCPCLTPSLFFVPATTHTEWTSA